MVPSADSSRFIPWPARPPRPFPAQQWVVRRFGFRLPPLHLRQRLPTTRREFPAKAWVLRQQRRAGSSALASIAQARK